MKPDPEKPRQPDQESTISSIDDERPAAVVMPRNTLVPASNAELIPAFAGPPELTGPANNVRFADACIAWLTKSTSFETRSAHSRELRQFLRFTGIATDHLDRLAVVRPHDVAAWRDHLRERGLSNTAIVRKITVLRSLFR